MKIVLITGASSGIGEAIARQLAVDKNTIIITGTNLERLEKVSSEIADLGAISKYYIADVRNLIEAEEIITKVVSEYGRIDVLVANAGVGRFKNLDEFTEEDFDIQFDVNVKGVFNYLKPVVKIMKEQKSGQIVVTSSNLGFKTAARCGIYAATKFALQAMVGALREELKGTGVKVGTINPGSVNTPWFDDRGVDEARRSKMLSAQDVAVAAMLLINQSKTSDIDHVLLHPGIH